MIFTDPDSDARIAASTTPNSPVAVWTALRPGTADQPCEGTVANKTTEPQLDDASYDEGRAAFKAGASIRGIVEACVAADTPLSEAKTFSAALGFADAALDKLRGIER